jgi:hypothetical protein
MDTSLAAGNGDHGETRLEWVPAGGLPSRIVTLANLTQHPVEWSATNPIRVPAFYRGQSSKPGYYWMASLGWHITYESKAERAYLMELDWAGTATCVLPQPFRLHFPRQARPYQHIPDFLTCHSDGSTEVVDVKGARQQGKPLNKLTFSLTRQVCEQLGFEFTVYAGPTRITEANLAFLTGYRSPGAASLDEYLPMLADVVAGQELTIEKMTARLAEAGVPLGVAPAVVWRAMWQRLLTTDLLHPLSTYSRVRLDSPTILGGAA